MEWLQSLLDSSTTPALTAFLLGLLTAISPCPLATNIAAIGFIGKDIENRHRIFRNGLLYTLGRIMAYTLLGIILTQFWKKVQAIWYPEIYRQIRRNATRTRTIIHRVIHAVRPQIQPAVIRFQR